MNMATVGVTMSEILRTSAELASNSVLRRQFEEDQRSQLNPGESFYVDEAGIGHFHGALHVTNVLTSVVDAAESHIVISWRKLCSLRDEFGGLVDVSEIPAGAYGLHQVPEGHVAMVLMKNAKFGRWELGVAEVGKFITNSDGQVAFVYTHDVWIDDFENIVRVMIDKYRTKDCFSASVLYRTTFDNGSLEGGLAISFKELS